jgi:hypothetical protein
VVGEAGLYRRDLGEGRAGVALRDPIDEYVQRVPRDSHFSIRRTRLQLGAGDAPAIMNREIDENGWRYLKLEAPRVPPMANHSIGCVGDSCANELDGWFRFVRAMHDVAILAHKNGAVVGPPISEVRAGHTRREVSRQD